MVKQCTQKHSHHSRNISMKSHKKEYCGLKNVIDHKNVTECFFSNLICTQLLGNTLIPYLIVQKWTKLK